MEKDYSASNLRALRRAFKIPQDKLGAVVGVEKSAISMYETGKRVIDTVLRKKFADFFGVSVEEFSSFDFSVVESISYNNSAFLKSVDKIFPIFVSNDALKNVHFRRAYTAHNDLYSGLKEGNANLIERINILGGYEDAFDDELAKYEATANAIGVSTLFYFLFYSLLKIIKNDSAITQVVLKNDSRIRSFIENIDSDDAKKEIDDILNDFRTPEYESELTKMFNVLKNSSLTKYTDLAYYYLALQFIMNNVDNDMDEGFNKRVSAEMLESFSSIGNKYAKSYLKFNDDMIGL